MIDAMIEDIVWCNEVFFIVVPWVLAVSLTFLKWLTVTYYHEA